MVATMTSILLDLSPDFWLGYVAGLVVAIAVTLLVGILRP